MQQLIRIGIVGPESTGKSTLSQQLATHFGGIYIPEYAREYVSLLTAPITYNQLEEVLQHNINEYHHPSSYASSCRQSPNHAPSHNHPTTCETSCELPTTNASSDKCPTFNASSHKPLKTQETLLCFYDTEVIITKVWYDVVFGHHPSSLDAFLTTHPMNYYLLLRPDIAWLPDPTRENGDQHIRETLFTRYLQEIEATHRPYAIISGTNTSRLLAAQTAVQTYLTQHFPQELTLI